MADPILTMKGIYENFGEHFTNPATAAMQNYLDANPKGKHGRHEYDLAEFGLSRASVRERYAGYIRRHDIPLSDND